MQALRRLPISELWREHSPVIIAIAVVLLLAASLLALIWAILHSPDPMRQDTRIIQLSLVTPAPAPPEQLPEPARQTVSIPQAPPPKPVPPKKPVEHRRDSAAVAPAPQPKPAPAQPKTHSASVDDPLSLDAPPDWKHFALPQGANAGSVIGGDGENSGGGGCGGGSTFLTFLISQLHTVFTRNQKVDSSVFHIQAQLWFDDQGAVQRVQLVQSTGKANLDASIRTALGEINVGRGMPRCVQPITVWVNQPSDGTSPGVLSNDGATGVHTEFWQNRTRARN